jgi:glutathione S-transferase
MIKIHHARRTRSVRVVWLLEELGVPYELATFEFTRENLRRPEYLALHPLGKIPVIQDRDVTLFESGAILEYLLEEHGGGRLAPPPGSRDRALYLQWFHFGEASLTTHVGTIVRHRFTLPEEERIPAAAEDGRVRLHQALELVDKALAERPFILGDEFTAADIMVAYGVAISKIMRELPPALGALSAYLSRMKERPAYERAWA